MRLPMIVVLLMLIGGYAALSHYSVVNDSAKGLATSLSLGPILLITVGLLWRWTNFIVAAIASATGAGVLYCNWKYLENHYEWADLMQQFGAYALVTAAFARSLLPGRIPLCTQIDQKLHNDLTPLEHRYTRIATLAWAGFYGAMAVSIVALFFTITPRMWSIYVNFITFALIILACVADYVLRQWKLPQRPHSGLLSILQRALLG